jgi:hypothetical protein
MLLDDLIREAEHRSASVVHLTTKRGAFIVIAGHPEPLSDHPILVARALDDLWTRASLMDAHRYVPLWIDNTLWQAMLHESGAIITIPPQ